MLLEYDELIKNQLKSGVVELVQTDSFPETGRVHYIPHHAVNRRNKNTTKVRNVYDVSARQGGPSLNDCLHAGQSLLPKTVDILIRFRFHKVALVSDVEKAFHQVSIAPDDRDVLRFLWIGNPVLPQPRVTVYCFVRAVFGVNSSPFLLNATIAHHINSYSSCDPGFVEKFLSSLYVDDFSGGAGTTAEAYELYLKAHKYILDWGFNLRKWQSNDRQLLELIQSNEKPSSSKNSDNVNAAQPVTSEKQKVEEDDSTYAQVMCGNEDSNKIQGQLKLLGLNWVTINDKFVFDLTKYADFFSREPLTKRAALRIVAKIYDPLGLLSPVVLPMKLLFQKLCTEKSADWDSQHSPELCQELQTWIEEMKTLKSFAVPRCYLRGINEEEFKSIELHGFGDASCAAFGAVIFYQS